MSLINQMLRDLEQRNPPNPNPAQPLNVRIASNGRGNKLSRLWLMPLLIALPAAYVWRQNQTVQTAPQPAAATAAAIAEPKQSPITAELPAPAPESAQAPLPEPKVSLDKPEQPVSKQETVNNSVKPTAKPAKMAPEKTRPASMPQPAKTAIHRERAESLYRQAQRSASAIMARANLEEALELDPLYLPARSLLLQTLLKSHASDAEIGAFLEKSLQLFPDNLLFIKTRAHLYVQQKNFSAAVRLLEQIDAETVDDSAYLSLLAAGYQQLQSFPQAERIYRQLTSIQPDKAENWLGLAIAQDKLNQPQFAAQSYRQALDKKTLNSEVVDYIKQRLSALN